MEIQKTEHVEVLNCLVKLPGLACNEVDQEYYSDKASGAKTL